MQDTAQPFDLGQSLKTSAVIGEVVDVQLREAAWATLARARQLAEPNSSLQALRRWENYLCGNMAGLASVMNTRLIVRLTQLLHEPKELHSEAFVAALLLLRCDRRTHESTVFAAWRAAASSPDRQHHLTQAMIHGGLQRPEHVQQLEEIIAGDVAPLTASAVAILAARGRTLGATLRPLGARARSCNTALAQVLQLMAHGVWPLDARPIAQGLQGDHPEAIHAAEQVLSCYGVEALAERARTKLRHNLDASLLGIEALAAMQLAHGPQEHDDLQLLGQAALRGRLGPLVAHALGLTGLESAAHLAVQLLRTTVTEPLQAAALEGFLALTGIEAPPREGHQGDLEDQLRPQRLLAAWGPPPMPIAPRDVQLSFGVAADGHRLAQAVPLMQVGRWQSLRRLLLARSLGAVRLSPWALVQQQLRELELWADGAKLALTRQAPGLSNSPLTRAMARLGAL